MCIAATSCRLIAVLLLLLTTFAAAHAQWVLVDSTEGLHGVSIHVDGTVMVVALRDGRLMRRNGAGAWVETGVGLPVGMRIFRVNYIDRRNQLALCTDSGLFVSTDRGESWSREAGLGFSNIGGVYSAIRIDSAVLIGSDSGAYKRVDTIQGVQERLCGDSLFGRSVNLIRAGRNRILCAAFRPGNPAMPGSAIHSLGSCTRVDRGFDSNAIALSAYVSDSIALIGSTKGIFRSTTMKAADQDMIWESLQRYGQTLDSAADFIDTTLGGATLVLGVGARGGFAYSIDSGCTWQFINDGLPGDPAVRALALHGDSVYLCLRQGGVYRRLLRDILLRIFTARVVYTPPGCAGYPVTLTVQALIPEVMLRASVEWRDRGSGNILQGSNLTVYPVTGTVYDVTITINTFGRIDTLATLAVPVQVAPRANAGPDLRICFGEAVQIGSPAEPNAAYSWQRHESLPDTSVAAPYVRPDTTTTYYLTVTGTDSLQCITHDTVTVTVLGGPRTYVLRTTLDTLTAGPRGSGFRYRWLRDEVSLLDDTLRRYTPKEPGRYAVAITDASGRERRSDPYLYPDPSGSQEPLFAPDVLFRNCVVGERKSHELILSNPTDDGTLVIEDMRFEPFDSLSCPKDSADFFVSSDFVGLIITREKPESVFLQFTPHTVGVKAARLVITYAIQEQNKKAKIKIDVVGGAVPQPDTILTTTAALDTVRQAAPGERTRVNFHIENVNDPKSLLTNNKQFHVTLTVPATLLQLTDVVSLPSCISVDSIKQCVPPGILQLRIDIRGDYQACKGALLLPFTAMLGQVSRGRVYVQQFLWTAVSEDSTTIEHLTEVPEFVLQGVCGSGENIRLVRPDGIGGVRGKLVVAPNPAATSLRLEYAMPAAGPADLTIHDVFGRVVRSERITADKVGVNAFEYDVAGIPAGTYFVTLTAFGKRITERFDIAR